MESIELYNTSFMVLDSASKSVFVRATDSWVLNLLSLPKTVEMCEIRMHLKMDLNPLWFLLIIVGFFFSCDVQQPFWLRRYSCAAACVWRKSFHCNFTPEREEMTFWKIRERCFLMMDFSQTPIISSEDKLQILL